MGEISNPLFRISGDQQPIIAAILTAGIVMSAAGHSDPDFAVRTLRAVLQQLRRQAVDPQC